MRLIPICLSQASVGIASPYTQSLLKITTVTPGITAQEYAQRRSRLAAKLPNDGIAILAAADVKYRSGAVFYEFHQDPNFFYLTGIGFPRNLRLWELNSIGFNEPDAVAIVGMLQRMKR